MNHKNERLQADIARQASAYKRLDEETDQLRSRARAEKEKLTKELDDTRKMLNDAVSKVKSLEAKLLAADEDAHTAWVGERTSDVEDYKALEDLRRALDKENKTSASLQEKLDEKSKQLLETEQQIHTAIDGQAESENEIVKLNGQIEELSLSIADRTRTIARYESDLLQLSDSSTAFTLEKGQLSTDLMNKTTELRKAHQDLVAAREEVTKLDEASIRQTATIQLLSTQLQEEKNQSESLRAQSETTIRELLDRINKLIKHDEQDEQNLVAIFNGMALLLFALNKTPADDESDKKNINQLKASINDLIEVQKLLQNRIGELTSHDAQDEFHISKLREAIAALETNLKNTAEQKKGSDDAASDLKKQFDGLQKKIAEATSNDAKDKETIKLLKEAQQAGERAIENFKAQTAAARKEAEDTKNRALDADVARKDADAAATKALLELDEAKKPQLPNDVVSFTFRFPAFHH